jgi:hypothetical protein
MANTPAKFSLAFRQIKEFPKSTPSERMQNLARLFLFLELSLRVPSCPRCASTTCVPAELRLNWVNVARVARMRRFATSRIRAHRGIDARGPSGQPPQLSDGGTGD